MIRRSWRSAMAAVRSTIAIKTLGMPNLILPSIQINIRAGRLPEADVEGHRYLTLPLNRF